MLALWKKKKKKKKNTSGMLFISWHYWSYSATSLTHVIVSPSLLTRLRQIVSINRNKLHLLRRFFFCFFKSKTSKNRDGLYSINVEIKTLEKGLAPPAGRRRCLHALELVDALFGVSRADLPQCFVLVSAHPDVLGVDDVVLSFLALVSGVGQLWTQSLR